MKIQLILPCKLNQSDEDIHKIFSYLIKMLTQDVSFQLSAPTRFRLSHSNNLAVVIQSPSTLMQRPTHIMLDDRKSSTQVQVFP